MGQILHGSATTTEAIRRATQNSQASLRVLAKRYGINQKTVATWRKRTLTAERPVSLFRGRVDIELLQAVVELGARNVKDAGGAGDVAAGLRQRCAVGLALDAVE